MKLDATTIALGGGMLVIATAFVYTKYLKKGGSTLPGYPWKRDPSTPETPLPLQAEQYEKYGYPYGLSYDNWLIHGAPVYKGGSTIFPPTLPLTTKTSDPTMVIPATKEYIFYYPTSQKVPEFLTPATFLRVKPPQLPAPQPWRYTNYYDQF